MRSVTLHLTAGERAEFVSRERVLWESIRCAAVDSFRTGERYRYATAPGVVHDCATMRELVAVTRRERTAAGVTWHEDR